MHDPYSSSHSHIYPEHKSLSQLQSPGPYWESVVELVGEQRVGQLSEVQLAEGTHWMDILSEDISGEVWDLFRVKLMPSGRKKEEENIEQSGSPPTAHLSV